jgi:electron transport complex protein RnfC
MEATNRVMALTFKGGIRSIGFKNTALCRIEQLTPPANVFIMINDGKVSRGHKARRMPVVGIGERVFRGQVIADTLPDEEGCPLHASVSGTVADIYEDADSRTSVVIENDMKYENAPTLSSIGKKLTECSTDEIIDVVRRAGIVGLGGRGYPTYKKIKEAVGRVEFCIINCAESEPFLTSDYRTLIEKPASVLNGLKILLKALGLRSGIVAVGEDKHNAAEKLSELVGDSGMIKIRELCSKYPQGAEELIVYSLIGRALGADETPLDAGCVVFNAQTSEAIFNAFATGMPLTSRVITVDGDCVARPANLLVPIGAKISDVLAHCGGFIKTPAVIISGGPLSGRTTAENDVITPECRAVIVLSDDVAFTGRGAGNEFGVCIRCGRCVSVCPMRLAPNYIATHSRMENYAATVPYGLFRCIECGCCAYVCPGRVPIVGLVRRAKEALSAGVGEEQEEGH